MHNQKTALLVYTMALGSVIRRVRHNLIVRLLTYQDFEGDGGILPANGSRLSLHINGKTGFKVSLLFEYMHV